MNKMKKLLSALAALLMMLTFAVPACAAAEGSQVEVKSGSTEAKVSFVVEDVLALEGTVSTAETTGFKVRSIRVEKAADGSLIDQNEWGDRVVIVGQNIPADIRLTVELESSSPMKNGSYKVTLNYGLTNHTGSFSANKKVESIIYVGIEAPSKDGDAEDSGENNTETTQKTTATTVEKTETIENGVLVSDNEETGSNRVGMLGLLDTYELRSALEEAEKLLEVGDLDAEERTMLQEAIAAGEEAMQDDRQSVIDEAADNLFVVIEELGGPVDGTKEEKTSEGLGRGVPWAIILAVAAALLAVAAVVAGYLMKKKKKNGYDGAPIVDYHIGDDDNA